MFSLIGPIGESGLLRTKCSRTASGLAKDIARRSGFEFIDPVIVEEAREGIFRSEGAVLKIGSGIVRSTG